MKKLFVILALLAVLASTAGAQSPQASTTTASTFRRYTVAALPAAPRTYTTVLVTDGSTAGDCTIGAGSTVVLCMYNGSAWVSLGGGAADAVDGITFNLTGIATGDVLCYDGAEVVDCDPSISNRVDSDGTVALLSSDRGDLVAGSHATANAVSIAQAGTAGFEAGFFTYYCSTGAGLSTITPTTSTINGLSTLTLFQRDCALIVSDGTNYFALVAQKTFTGYIDMDAATCVGAVASNNWDDSPTLTEPAAACISATPTTYGVSSFDDATDEGYQAKFYLPADWTGAIDIDFIWHGTATTGAVAWAAQTGCVADAEVFSLTFNTASVVSDTAKGTANQANVASLTAVSTTGCAAGELMFVQVYRDGNGTGATDDFSGDAHLVKVRLKTRRLTVQ